MNRQSTLKTGGSLLERAAEVYDFRTGLLRDGVPSAPAPEPAAVKAPKPVRAAPAPKVEPAPKIEPTPKVEAARPAPQVRRPVHGLAAIDREGLAEAGFIVPGGAASAIAEEFRIIKRQLLSAARDLPGLDDGKRRMLLVASANADEGKTFCALNLALSLAGEKDVEVLLVDGDFPKPEILSLLGIEGGPGLVEAIENEAADPESYIVRTDVPGLSVLPAGRQANNVTELLASVRTQALLASLAAANSRRIIIFDSPPALLASPATVLASHVGQAVVVVRADRTTEADLREAVGLLSACEHISLVLNGAGFAASARRFGTYYGYSQ